jgi:hypothetical protein
LVADLPYREPSEPQAVRPDPYLVAWAELRRRRARRSVALPVCSAAGLASLAILGVNAPFVVIPACIVGVMFALSPAEFICPRCGRRFTASGRRDRDPAQCGHCGLCIGTPRFAGVGRERPGGASSTGEAESALFRIPPDPYLVAWAKLQRRRWLVGFGFLAWVPVGSIVGTLADRALGKGGLMFPVLPLFTAIAFAIVSLGLSRCPHCGQSPFSGRGFRNVLTSTCLHCGIRFGTPKSAMVADSKRG